MTHSRQAGPESRHLPAPPSEHLPVLLLSAHTPLLPGPGPIHMCCFCLFGWFVFRSAGPAELVGFDVILSNRHLFQWKLRKVKPSPASASLTLCGVSEGSIRAVRRVERNCEACLGAVATHYKGRCRRATSALSLALHCMSAQGPNPPAFLLQ